MEGGKGERSRDERGYQVQEGIIQRSTAARSSTQKDSERKIKHTENTKEGEDKSKDKARRDATTGLHYALDTHS